MNPFSFLASLFYRAGLQIDRARKSKKARALSRPVVSIGNITVGGTGKTPLLFRLLNDLQDKSLHPAVLSRGYRGLMKSDGVNDESILLKEKFPSIPVGVGSNRANAADLLLEKNKVDLFVLDDGFQHWALQRNIDLVCLDATHKWEEDSLLPAGRLREPIENLERASLIILTRCELLAPEVLESRVNALQALVPNATILKSRLQLEFQHPHTNESVSIKGKNVLAVCAIGNPKAFERNLEKEGAYAKFVEFPDHMDYTQKTLDQLEKKALHDKRLIVTTEKDWVKMKRLSWGKALSLSIVVAKATLVFDVSEQQKWTDFIDEKIKTLC